MKDLDLWLNDLSSKPLPGAVAAAAATAAMGAALIAKAARITLEKRQLDTDSQNRIQTLWNLAENQRYTLIDLAHMDDRAYRAVLDTRSQAASSPARTRAWLQATETPIRLAEECRALLDFSAPLLDTCWPAVCPDPEIGIWLLETGIRAGLAAAEGNIAYCGDTTEAMSLRHRIAALK
jgi:formiminotetrahydrofolate cyclodeaminase